MRRIVRFCCQLHSMFTTQQIIDWLPSKWMESIDLYRQNAIHNCPFHSSHMHTKHAMLSITIDQWKYTIVSVHRSYACLDDDLYQTAIISLRILTQHCCEVLNWKVERNWHRPRWLNVWTMDFWSFGNGKYCHHHAAHRPLYLLYWSVCITWHR